MNGIRGLLVCLLSAILFGCTTEIVSIPYYPDSGRQFSGSIDVQAFEYGQKYWSSTSLPGYSCGLTGCTRMSEGIDDYFGKALKKDLAASGITVSLDSKCRISGSVEYVYFGSVCESKVVYMLRNDRHAVYASIIKTQFACPDVIQDRVMKTVGLNIRKLKEDRDFSDAVRFWCNQDKIAEVEQQAPVGGAKANKGNAAKK